MALTALQKMQAKMRQMQQGKKQYWTPPEGKNLIRVLPPWEKTEDALFYKEVPTHYKVGPDRDRVVQCSWKLDNRNQTYAHKSCIQ